VDVFRKNLLDATSSGCMSDLAPRQGDRLAAAPPRSSRTEEWLPKFRKVMPV